MLEDGNSMVMGKGRKMEKEWSLEMNIFMMVILREEKDMEKEDCNIKMEIIMKVIGEMGKWMDREYFSINIILLFMKEDG
jgi:hypothetical protein